jgi:hypothetical protein
VGRGQPRSTGQNAPSEFIHFKRARETTDVFFAVALRSGEKCGCAVMSTRSLLPAAEESTADAERDTEG